MVHDERTLEELRERITPRWGNWLSADTWRRRVRAALP